ncbi:MAG TPA: glycosyltransferase family 2 protein [Edaphocola sp.]|nr:glycosyltransferase family 2 protein [Edaphocola sp.]
MENNPQVAVMMPVYNGEKTLGLALSSLVHQTYPYWKCYIVNDGSTDGTKEILEGLTDPRFVIIHFEQNKGRPYARQAALDAAEGKYLAMLDADDIYHPNKLKVQVEYFERNPMISLLSSGMGSYENLEEGIIRVRGNKIIECRMYNIGDRVEYVHAPSMLILKDAKNTGYNKSFKYSQDMEFLDRYLNGKYYSSMNEIVYYYSEFDSVSKAKVIKTYFYVLRKIRNSEMSLRLKIKEYIQILGKIIIYSILYPFVSVEFFLKKRGVEAIPEMKAEFKNVIKKIRT